MGLERKFLLPGEYHATTRPMELVTVLGSCVSVCLYNSVKKSAAMNHFKLPESANSRETNIGLYGNTSIDHILKTLMVFDAELSHYEAKIFGGCDIIGVSGPDSIGSRNIAMAEKILAKYSIPIRERDLKWKKGHRISFNTAENKVVVGVEAPPVREVEPVKSQPLGTPQSPARVLIVDDSPIVRKLLSAAINTFPGFQACAMAEDAFEARDLLLSHKPDLITLDIVMPKMNGVEFLNTHFSPFKAMTSVN